jgi:hypothetical protein
MVAVTRAEVAAADRHRTIVPTIASGAAAT